MTYPSGVVFQFTRGIFVTCKNTNKFIYTNRDIMKLFNPMLKPGKKIGDYPKGGVDIPTGWGKNPEKKLIFEFD